MKILNYTQREEMKIYGEDYDVLIEYAHWQRFIEMFVKRELDFPDFVTYRNWLAEFPGWTHGEMNETHALWSRFSHLTYFPMNEYYNECRGLY
jgi:hypothetical protein